jgi:hypothetical protein
MLLVQILAAVVFFGLIALAILAFIEPGPLDRRSRDRRGRSADEQQAGTAGDRPPSPVADPPETREL